MGSFGGGSGLWDALSGKDLKNGIDQYLNAPIEAAQIQAAAQLKAQKMQLGMFNKIVGQEQPFLQGGYSSESQLQDLLGLGGVAGDRRAMNALHNLPGFKFQEQQGDLGIQAQGSATGSALGGATMKAMSQYNQGLAGTYYNNYVNQLLQNTGIGLNAASNTGTAGSTLGTGAAQAEAAMGASQAAGITGQANNMATAAGGIAGLIGAFV